MNDRWLDGTGRVRAPHSTARDPAAPVAVLLRLAADAPSLAPEVLRNPMLRAGLAVDPHAVSANLTGAAVLVGEADCPEALLHMVMAEAERQAAKRASSKGLDVTVTRLLGALLRNPNLPRDLLERARAVLRAHPTGTLVQKDMHQHRQGGGRVRLERGEQDFLTAYRRVSADAQDVAAANSKFTVGTLQPEVEAALTERRPQIAVRYRPTRPETLRSLAGSAHQGVLEELVRLPDLPVEAMLRLARNAKIRANAFADLAGREDAPLEVLEAVVDRVFEDAAELPDHHFMEVPPIGDVTAAIYRLVNHPRVSEALLWRLGTCRWERLQDLVAGARLLSDALLEEMWRRAGSRPSQALTQRYHERFQVEPLSRDARALRMDVWPGLLAVGLERLGAFEAELLARHVHPMVRYGVARHPDTPTAILLLLTGDGDKRVAARAQQRLAELEGETRDES